MSLTTSPTHSPAFLDIVWDNKVCIGQAVCEESGFWVFYPNDKPGYYESHTLVHIAALLDRLNAPYNEELRNYFSIMPKEIDQTVRHDDTPF
jgi:hypothetical protein